MKKNQQGFSLIEVLTALLILAIGLLSQMALQVTGISSTRSSYNRSQAAILANDFTERMRLNVQGVVDGRYDTLRTINMIPDCSAACSSDEQANLDIAEFSRDLAAAIPASAASVTRLNNNALDNEARFSIVITWNIEGKTGLANMQQVNRVSFVVGVGVPG